MGALDEELLDAVMNGCSASTISSLINRGANPNAQYSWDGCPVLYNAVAHCDSDAIKVLLDAGAYPNQYWNDATALHYACEGKKTDSALALIDAGAGVNRKGPSGWTPIMYASMNCDVRLAKRLLEEGADPSVSVNDIDAWDMTPIYTRSPLTLALCTINRAISVTEEDRFEIVCLLIRHGATLVANDLTAYVSGAAKRIADKARISGCDDVASFLDKFVSDVENLDSEETW